MFISSETFKNYVNEPLKRYFMESIFLNMWWANLKKKTDDCRIGEI